MKVLYFHQHFTTPSLGGGTRSYEFAKKLIERGHEVTMVCGGVSEFNFKNIISKGVSRGNVEGIDVIQINLPYSNSDGIFKRTIVFIKYALKGIQIQKQEKYDLLFATSTPLTAGIPGIWMKLFNKESRKFVFEVRDLWPELPKALGLRNPFILRGMSFLEKLSYRKADACIGLSPGICQGISKKIEKGKLVKLIPNGCDLDLFKPGNRKDLVMKGVLSSDFLAVFTGAHGVANGLDAVLDLASELKKRKRFDIKIAFIGDGKLKKDLMERAKSENLDNCLFFDPISKTALKDIIANADVGLMVLKNVPEFYYGTSPNKFFDYIASGIPVINNYPGWLAELISENSCGEVVAANHANDFADAMIKLADNPSLCKEYAKNSRTLAERSFARNSLANEFVDTLEEVMIKS